MATLYLNRRSTSVSREGEHLLVKHHDHGTAVQSQVLPVIDLSSVVVIGEPSITFPALSCFIQRQIPVSFLSVSGRWRGCIDTNADAYGERHLKQYQTASNRDFTLPVAKALLSAKLYNARRLIQRLAAARSQTSWVTDEDQHHDAQLKWIAQHLHQCASVNALRGLEGLGAMHYFALLRHFLPEDAGFTKRQRHPAKDPANALLSWTYTLLLSELLSILRQHHLDPAIGVLHVNANRAPALALDLIEPFRSACADRLVLHLFNHRIIQPQKHFQRQPSGALLLNEAGRATFFNAYETALNRSFVDPKTGQNTSLRAALHQHVQRYLRCLEDFSPNTTPSPTFFHLP